MGKSRRDFLKMLAGTAFSAVGVASAAPRSSAKARRPNILFFFVDDMGWQDISEPFHTDTTELNRRYHTPNMETLADEGMKFTQAYACALCSPSRVSLMTGMNTARHMVTNWTLRKNVQPDGRHPKVKSALWNVNGMSATPGVERTIHAVTLPALLKKAGYRTIHCGKSPFRREGHAGRKPPEFRLRCEYRRPCRRRAGELLRQV